MSEPEQLRLFDGTMPEGKPEPGPRRHVASRFRNWEQPARTQLALVLPEVDAKPGLWRDDPACWRGISEPPAWAALPAQRFIRDYQRRRVYRWESRQSWSGGASLPLELRAELVRSLTGLSKVEIRPGRKHARRAWARWSDGTVSLPPYMRTRAIVCHEAAHLRACDNHGPAFMRVYCRFLDLAGLVSETEAAESARAAGIDVAPLPVLAAGERTEGDQ
jgi:hypothetical protein